MKMFFHSQTNSGLSAGLKRRALPIEMDFTLPFLLAAVAALAKSECIKRCHAYDTTGGCPCCSSDFSSCVALPVRTQTDFHLSSLAVVEMKVLLRQIYSRFQTRIAPDMGSMEAQDHVLGARLIDQTCKLIFTVI